MEPLASLVVVLLTTKIGLAITVSLVYLTSLVLHPMVTCRSCGGDPCHRGAFFSYAHGYCGRCDGEGEVRRWGSSILRLGGWHPPRR